MKKLKTFIRENRIRMSLEYTGENPWMDNQDMNHYQVTLKRNRKQFSTYFSTGYGWDHDPSSEDVLDTLASDAAGIENARDFSDWCNEYGFSDDSIRANRIYKISKRQAEKLKKFLGDELYNDLLWEVERE